jgi:hypothetical protein
VTISAALREYAETPDRLSQVEAGTPALVTHALPDTSYPILLRLGFEEVCSLRRLEDS